MGDRKLSVLIIEDNRFDLEMLSDLLTRIEGNLYRLSSHNCLSDGLKLLETHTPDIILLDLNLPDSKGLDTLNAILGSKVNAAIVVISGDDDEKTALEAVKRGAQDYLVKGSLTNHLVSRAIRYAVERNQIEQELKAARQMLEQRVNERTAELSRVNEELTREIAEKKKTELILSQSEEKLRDFFENAIDSAFIVDISGKITSINHAFETLTGYTREEIIGKSALSLVKPSARNTVKDIFTHLYTIGEPVAKITNTIMAKDGHELFIEGHISITRKNGQTTGLQGTLRDITEITLIEGQMLQTQKMEVVAALAGGMAHSFNNLLVGIIGYAEYLLGKKEKGDPDYRPLKMIHQGSMRISDLTRQLLNIARAGSYLPIQLNLNDVIENVIPLMRVALDKSVEIKKHLSPNLQYIKGDLGQLEQCLLNLALNAKDAMPKGGTFTIETKNHYIDTQFAKSHLGVGEGWYVVVSLADTGIGIPLHIQGRIFDPFFTTKEDTGGTGMGLCSAYGIVKIHNGTITVNSSPGEGAVFNIYFPALTAPPTKKTGL
jgi:two-component system, cell cycle sensor histidine kinase and response regulator CckA